MQNRIFDFVGPSVGERPSCLNIYAPQDLPSPQGVAGKLKNISYLRQ